MAIVTLNEAAIARLLNSTTGPVGRDIARRADNVGTLASQNAAGPVIGIESGRLLAGIKVRVEGTAEGVRAVVSTDATAYDASGAQRLWNGAPFSYPAYHDQFTGRPWLTQALRDGINL
jgi:hypothetical protein